MRYSLSGFGYRSLAGFVAVKVRVSLSQVSKCCRGVHLLLYQPGQSPHPLCLVLGG